VFNHLHAKLNETLTSDHIAGSPALPADKKLAVCLKYLGSHETILDISQLFSITEASAIKARREVIMAILVHFKEVVAWPSQEEYNAIAEYFQHKDDFNFPNIIGAIDGTHVPISKPHEHAPAFYNRKKFHSIIVQAVCREDLRFTDLCIGQPGRMHDARVLRNSDLCLTGFERCLQGEYHLIGDCAYPLTRWLMTPYRNVAILTHEQHNYNRALSARRVEIEKAFGCLKRRFRRLLCGIDMVDLVEINQLVMGACVLHNLCMLYDEEQDFLEDDQLQGNINPAVLQPLQNFILPNDGVEGRLKRLNITNHL
jgi:hypothetical protein